MTSVATIVVPAYEPAERLVEMVARLHDAGHPVLVVDDGSGAAYAALFDRAARAGAEVITHESNRGKGAAVKTALAHLTQVRPKTDVVTADADGQHTVADIRRVALALVEDRAANETNLVLGCREFGRGIPLRSRFGNAVASAVFRVASGWRLRDTQTGLRGIPAAMIGWAARVEGTRFEYEQLMLLTVRRDGWSTRQVPIETVYLDDNASSHFRPVIDSVRVMLPVLMYTAASFASFLVDTVALLVLNFATGLLVPSVVAARVISAVVNFLLNRRFVFGRQSTSLVREGARYALLATAVLASNIVWMTVLTDAGVPVLAAKIATESALFALGYRAQRTHVFAGPVPRAYAEGTDVHLPVYPRSRTTD